MESAKANSRTGVSAILERCLTDLSVFSPERLDYVAGADIASALPFIQRRPLPTAHAGTVLDLDSIPDPTQEEREEYARLLAAEHARVKPEWEAICTRHVKAQNSTMTDDEVLQEVAKRQQNFARSHLPADHVLELARGGTLLAGEITRKHHGLACADPDEPSYGPNHAKIYWDADKPHWVICSLAHGFKHVFFPGPGTPVPGPLPATPPTQDPGEFEIEGTTYVMSTRGIYRSEPDLTGKARLYPLTNFGARIIEEVTRDDGSGDLRKMFKIAAIVKRQRIVIDVRSKDYSAMGWVTEQLGSEAVLMAGQGVRDQVREAIQVLSSNIVHRHVYEHTGWRDIDGEHVYLTGSSGITAHGLRTDIAVELYGNLGRFLLPAPPSRATLTGPLQASLELRDLLPDKLMAAPLGIVYLAPLREFLLDEPPDLTVWLHGGSGLFT
jgi:hypothetical protein